MIDIVGFDEKGMQVYDTQTEMAANIIGVQLGSLEYAPDIGIDLEYFLTEAIAFQNTSFVGYLVQILASHGINVASIQTVINALDTDLNINLGRQENTTALVVE